MLNMFHYIYVPDHYFPISTTHQSDSYEDSFYYILIVAICQVLFQPVEGHGRENVTRGPFSFAAGPGR